MPSFFQKIFRSFIDGLLIAVPFFLTIFLALYPLNKLSEWLSSFVNIIFKFFLTKEEDAMGYPHIPFLKFLARYFSSSVIDVLYFFSKVPYMNLVLVAILIVLFGFTVSSVLVQSGVKLLERVIVKVPGMNLLYSYVKESTAGFLGKFNKPVLVTVNKELKIQKIGFMTQENIHTGKSFVGKIAVYLPHSYGFSGELVFFPATEVEPLKISSTSAWKLVASGGLAAIKHSNKSFRRS